MSVVLVTGSSRGIGLATALHFARLGHDVHAAVRNPAAATELARALATETLPVPRSRSTSTRLIRSRAESRRCSPAPDASTFEW